MAIRSSLARDNQPVGHQLVLYLTIALIICLLSGPAVAEHTIIQEEVVTVRNCEVLPPVMDVSLGFPVILVPMGCGDNEPPTIMMYVRRKDSASTNAGAVTDFDRNPDQDWSNKVLEVLNDSGISNCDELQGSTLGSCNGSEEGNCVSANFVYTDGGQTFATSYEQFFTDEGLFTGSSTVRTRPIAWPAGSAPTLMGSNPFGIPLAGWGPNGLSVLGDIGSSPITLLGLDEVNWVHDMYPPTALGTDSSNNPYVVVLPDEEYINTYVNQPDGNWTTITTPLPEGAGVGEGTLIAATTGGATPTGTLATKDGVIVHYPDFKGLEPELFQGERCALFDEIYAAIPQGWRKEDVDQYVIQQCGLSGKFLITIREPATPDREARWGHVAIDGIPGDLSHVVLDPDGNLQFVTEVTDTDSNGNITEKVVYTKVIIDNSQIIWGDPR